MPIIRDSARVLGTVFDLPHALSLSSNDCNVLLVSSRTLYFIQAFGRGEVGFLARYASQFLAGGYYELANTDADVDAINDIVNNYNLEVVDMSCDVVAELKNIAQSISEANANNACCGEIGSGPDTDSGAEGGNYPDDVDGQPYSDGDPLIVDRKCKAANYIHQAVRDTVNELKLNRADSYGFTGLQFVLTMVTTVIGALVAGPFGALVGAAAGGLLSMAVSLFSASFSLTLLHTAITADEQGAVCALYNSYDAVTARTAYTNHLLSNGATAPEIEFVTWMLNNNVLNLLFFAWGDSETAINDVTVEQSCAGCAPPAGCAWEFRTTSQPTGTGDLTKDGSVRTLTAEEGTDGNWRIQIQLDTVSGNPGEDCNGKSYVNATYQIISYNPSQPAFSTGNPRGWIGGTWTVHGNFPEPPTQQVREAAQIFWTAQQSFTVDIRLMPGDA